MSNIVCKKCGNTKCTFALKSEAKKARKGIHEILFSTMKKLKEHDDVGIGFSPRIVGSAKRNLIVKHGKEKYDTDIQIEFNGKKAKNLKGSLKELFHTTLSSCLPKHWTSEISTSVITVFKRDNNGDLLHSFDLAIIRRVNGNDSEILKGKVSDKTSPHYYKWNQMKSVNDAYKKWKKVGKKLSQVKERYLNKKCNRRGVDKDSLEYKQSSILFIDAVNEVMK